MEPRNKGFEPGYKNSAQAFEAWNKLLMSNSKSLKPTFKVSSKALEPSPHYSIQIKKYGAQEQKLKTVNQKNFGNSTEAHEA